MAFEPEATRGQGGTTGEAVSGSGRESGEEGRLHGLREKTRDVMHDSRERTTDAMSRAGGRARSQLESRKSQAVQSLGAVASALRESGENLRRRDETVAESVLNRVADGVDRFSSYLNSRNVDDMMHDVQSFARRRPEVFLGAFFALGVMAARFLKSGRGEMGTDRYGYSYVHGTEGARLPEVRETSRGGGALGFGADRGYSEGGPFTETGVSGAPYTQRRERGYSAASEGSGQWESRETEGERGGGERESDRFER